MAGCTLSWILCFVVLLALSHHGEGSCEDGRTPVTPLCSAATISGPDHIFLEANLMYIYNERCNCQISSNTNNNIDISPVIPLSKMACGPQIDFRSGTNRVFYSVDCFQGAVYSIKTNTPIDMDLSGSNGHIRTCISFRSTGAVLTLTCTEKTIVGTTAATTPTTTIATTPTTVASTEGQTTAATSQGQTTGTTPQGQTTGTTPQGQTTAATTQGQTTAATSQGQTTGATTQGQTTGTTPQGQTTAATSQGQTTAATSQGQTTAASTQGQTSTASQTSEGQTTPEGSTPEQTTQTGARFGASLFNSFPVEIVAGAVGGGLLLIILLVICITCCVSRRQPDRARSDEEMLKGRDSPEMIEEKDPNPISFNNQLYYDSGMGTPGKSVSPTVSDAGTDDFAGTKGMEELYAHVNKGITDSTDIM